MSRLRDRATQVRGRLDRALEDEDSLEADVPPRRRPFERTLREQDETREDLPAVHTTSLRDRMAKLTDKLRRRDEELEELRVEFDKQGIVARDAERLRAHLRESAVQLEELRQELGQSQERNQRFESGLKKARQLLVEQRDGLKEAQAQGRELRQELDAQRQTSSSAEELQRQLDEALAELAEAHLRLQAEEALCQELTSLRLQLEHSQERQRELEIALQKAVEAGSRGERSELLEAKLRGVTAQLQDTRAQLGEARQDLQHYLEGQLDHPQPNTSLLADLNRTQERNRKLESKLRQAVAALQSARQRLSQEEATRLELEGLLFEKDRELGGLRHDMAEQAEALESSWGDISRLEDELEQSREESEKGRGRLVQELQQSAAALQETRQQLASHQGQARSLQDNLEKALLQRDALRDKLQHALSVARTQAQELQAYQGQGGSPDEMREWEVRARKSQAKLSEAVQRLRVQSSQIKETHQALQHWQEKAGQLEQTLEKSRSAQTALEQRYEALQQRLEQSQELLNQVESDSDEWRKSALERGKQLAELEHQLRIQVQLNSENEDRMRELVARLESQSRGQDQVRELEVASLEELLLEQQGVNDTLQQELDCLKLELSNRSLELTRTQEKMARLESEKKNERRQIQAELERRQLRQQALEDKLREAAEALRQSRLHKRNKEDQVGELTRQLEQLQVDAAEQALALTKSCTEITAFQAELEQERARSLQLQGDNQRFSGQNQQLQAEAELQRAALEELQSDLQDRLDALQEKLRGVQSEAEQDRQRSNQRIRQLEEEERHQQAHQERLRHQLEVSQQRQQALEDRLRGAAESLRQAKKHKQLHQEQMAELQGDLERLRGESAEQALALEQSWSELGSFQDELAREREQNQELVGANQRMQEQLGQLSEQLEQFRVFRVQAEERQQALEQSQSERRRLQEELEQRLERQRLLEDKLRGAAESLRKSRQQLQDKDLQVAELTRELQDLREDSVEQGQALDQSWLEVSQAQDWLENEKQQAAALRQRNLELQAQVDQLQQQWEEGQALLSQRDLELLEQQAQLLDQRTLLQDWENRSLEAQQELHVQQLQLGELRGQITALELEKERTRQVWQSLHGRLEETQALSGKRGKAVEHLAERIRKLNEERQQREQYLGRLKSVLEAKTAEHQQLKSQCDELQASLSQTRDAWQGAQERLSQIESSQHTQA